LDDVTYCQTTSKLKDQQNGHSKTNDTHAHSGAKINTTGAPDAGQTASTCLYRLREYLSALSAGEAKTRAIALPDHTSGTSLASFFKPR